MERALVDLVTGQHAERLDVERELRRRAGDPGAGVLDPRDAVERGVDLDRVEALGVVAQALLGGGDALGVPALDHRLVGPRTRADHDISHTSHLPDPASHPPLYGASLPKDAKRAARGGPSGVRS